MKKNNLLCETTVLENREEGAVIEIIVRGNHHRNHGNELYDFIENAIEAHNPAAIVLNFLEYEYNFGNDMFSPIIISLYDKKLCKIRPCSIVAAGNTAKSLESLIDESNIRTLGKINIEIAQDIEVAQKEVRRQLQCPSTDLNFRKT